MTIIEMGKKNEHQLDVLSTSKNLILKLNV